MRRYVTEFIGTFFLVLTVCSVSLSGASLAPLAIGAVLAAMIFAGGHISGGHYNPAVSLAAYVRGRLGLIDLACYAAAQLVAGVIAAFLAKYIVATTPEPFTVATADLLPAFLAELLFTFALAYVVLNVATSRDHPNNSFYGLGIGLTVIAGAVAVGIGVVVASLVSVNVLWIYLVATLAGGAAAGVVFRMLNPDDK